MFLIVLDSLSHLHRVAESRLLPFSWFWLRACLIFWLTLQPSCKANAEASSLGLCWAAADGRHCNLFAMAKVHIKTMQNKHFFDIFQIYFGSKILNYRQSITYDFETLKNAQITTHLFRPILARPRRDYLNLPRKINIPKRLQYFYQTQWHSYAATQRHKQFTLIPRRITVTFAICEKCKRAK